MNGRTVHMLSLGRFARYGEVRIHRFSLPTLSLLKCSRENQFSRMIYRCIGRACVY